MRGTLDGLTGTALSGWAVDETKPTISVPVVISIDGMTIGTTFPTDQPSPDVTAAFPAYTGPHRFKAAIPAAYQDGKPHVARATAGGTTLTGSPFSFTLGTVPVPPTGTKTETLTVTYPDGRTTTFSISFPGATSITVTGT